METLEQHVRALLGPRLRSFDGHASRSEYATLVAGIVVFHLLGFILDMVVVPRLGIFVFTPLSVLLAAWPHAAGLARRLRDISWPTWWAPTLLAAPPVAAAAMWFGFRGTVLTSWDPTTDGTITAAAVAATLFGVLVVFTAPLVWLAVATFPSRQPAPSADEAATGNEHPGQFDTVI